MGDARHGTRAYAAGIGLDYVTNDDRINRPFDAPPVIVNYFYHEQIRKSVGEEGDALCRSCRR